jgi:diaminohydroxyphosphoribosylaminopyrimidine deaminase / 5-amino-6-(5-phosphoribosylamino)uracil reductase
MTKEVDEHYMRLALGEARKGLGRTSPNPTVGAVIVKDEQVIGRGFHRRAGMAHAEIEAFRNATAPVVGATMYVTLEPCNHTGRTPPCSRALVAAGISRVVIGSTDPNPQVNGSGIRHLQEHGIEVVSGVLDEKCQELNQPFIKHVTTGLPWVIMKAGVSLDGRLNYRHGRSGWITGGKSRRAAHRLRDRVDAILVGRGTVVSDNPSLTTRLAKTRGHDPIRVIVDSSLSVPLSATVYNLHSLAPTWVFCRVGLPPQNIIALERQGIRVWQVEKTPDGLDLGEIVKILGKEGVCSLLVEGGSAIHGSFLRRRLVDYAHLFYAPLFAGDGGEALVGGYQVEKANLAPRLSSVVRKVLGEDLLVSGKVIYPPVSGEAT